MSGITSTSTNAAGCTHTETLNLTINKSTSHTTSVSECTTYTWAAPLGNGTTYTSSVSGITSTSTNAAGCTHTETLNLTIKGLSSAPSVTTPVTYCVGEGASALSASGTSLLWYTVATGGTGSSTAPTPSTATVGSTYYYVSQTEAGKCEGARAKITVTISPNSICPSYTGIYFINTSSTTTGGTATFNLTYTITGAGCNGIKGLGVTNFKVSASSDNPATITYGTKTYNSSTGLLTIPVTVKLGNVYSAGVTFTLELDNAPNYIISSTCSDPILITVSSKSDGFVTGGGFIIPSNATGTIGLGANGLRTNFGFNIKYNKSGTNLQGNWNTIMRTSTGLWQVKSSKPTYLFITKMSATSYKADMVFSAANIKNLNTGVSYGTGTINVTVYDNGEPGSGVDQIFIKVTDGATIYYTSSSSANLTTPSSIPTLKQGNIQIHLLGAKVAARVDGSTVISDLSTATVVTTSPNPFVDEVRFTVVSPRSGKAVLELHDAVGRKVAVVYNGYLFEGRSQVISYNVPASLKGALIYTLRVGKEQVNGKIIRMK